MDAFHWRLWGALAIMLLVLVANAWALIGGHVQLAPLARPEPCAQASYL